MLPPAGCYAEEGLTYVSRESTHNNPETSRFRWLHGAAATPNPITRTKNVTPSGRAPPASSGTSLNAQARWMPDFTGRQRPSRPERALT